MAKKRTKEARAARTASRRLNFKNIQRIVVLGAIFGVAAFVILFAKLWQLQVVEHEELQKRALSQQTRVTASTAHRGTIYDATGDVLAISGPVKNVILSPRDLWESADVSTVDEFGNPRSQTIIDAEREQKVWDKYELIVNGLSDILDIPESEIEEKLEKKNSRWQPIAKKVEDDVVEQVNAFIEENELDKCVYMSDDSKRYYPYSNIATQVVGFVNSENQGSYGIEALYNSELAGENGKTITAKNASGREMLSPYADFTNAVDGYDVHTTIDTTIQLYAENTLEAGVQRYDVINGAFCIVMRPSTGAILALASYPDYDLNDPNKLTDPIAIARLKQMKRDPKVSDEEYEKAYSQAQFVQWRSKCLNTTYEPGSTFKPLVLAAALDEGAVTENDSFYCSGVLNVAGWPIRCSARRGHGSQSLRRAVMNSCNPAFIRIGQRLGASKFWDYWEAYGFTERTGIELPGEESSAFWNKDKFISPAGIANLATASFGQRFEVTPIQLITALCATINGGHLMQPYLVQSVTDSDGNVVSYHEPEEVRQVISEETSAQVRDILESVVSSGTGKNAYMGGYRIGGKTGSSQTNNVDHIIVSFLGFAPANDPEIAVLLAYDWPRPAVHEGNRTSSGIYISGGDMAAPLAGPLIANVLDYLGKNKPGVTAETNTGITVPRLTGYALEDAQSSLSGLGLGCRISGEGSLVTDQAPSPGSIVPDGTSIVLYLGEEKPKETVEMPDLINMNFGQVVATLDAIGLYLSPNGASEDGIVFTQSVAAGTPIEVGSTIEVQFINADMWDEAIIDEGAEGFDASTAGTTDE